MLVLGSTLGGVLLGAGTSILGATLNLVGENVALGVGLGCLAIALAALTWPSLVRAPGRLRQVRPEDLSRFPLWLVGLRWGTELGVGFATRIVTPALYAVFGLSLAMPGFPALLVSAVYGFVRGLAIAAASWTQFWDRGPFGRSGRNRELPVSVGIGARTRGLSAALISSAGVIMVSRLVLQ